MDNNLDLWKLAAGLAVFLYGMFLLEDAIKIMSGRAFRRMIRSYTNGRLRSVSSGAFITAILQSSSAVSLMVLAFVGAGVMTMENWIGVMMGANIGTTFTSWIVAVFGFKMKIESLDDYQIASRKTWHVIAVDHPIVYPTLGLSNEVGEVAGKINAANLRAVHAKIESGSSRGKTVLEGF